MFLVKFGEEEEGEREKRERREEANDISCVTKVTVEDKNLTPETRYASSMKYDF